MDVAALVAVGVHAKADDAAAACALAAHVQYRLHQGRVPHLQSQINFAAPEAALCCFRHMQSSLWQPGYSGIHQPASLVLRGGGGGAKGRKNGFLFGLWGCQAQAGTGGGGRRRADSAQSCLYCTLDLTYSASTSSVSRAVFIGKNGAWDLCGYSAAMHRGT